MNRDKFLRPDLIVSQLLKKEIQGTIKERDDIDSPFLRALVIAVDVEGGKLENPDGAGSVEHEVDGRSFSVPANVGPENPRNSIKAKMISNGLDKFLADDSLRVFWPFFPEHLQVPIKPGEHVYVVFEGGDMDHGLWFSKIPGHENLNYFRGRDSFKERESLAEKFPDNPPSQDVQLNTDSASTESKIGDRLSSLFE